MPKYMGDYGYIRFDGYLIMLIEVPLEHAPQQAGVRFNEILDAAHFDKKVSICGCCTEDGMFTMYAACSFATNDCTEIIGELHHFRTFVENAGFTLHPEAAKLDIRDIPIEIRERLKIPALA